MRNALVLVAALAGYLNVHGATHRWEDNSTNETGFRIERALADRVFVPIGSVGPNATTYVDVTTQAGVAYLYRLAAFNDFGLSAYSNVAAFDTPSSGATNSPPTISNLAAQTAFAGVTLGPIEFVVGDAETAASALSVSAQSSNPTLLPLSGIVMGGAGANRTLTVTTLPGQTGSAEITLSVSDGELSTATTFLVTVSALNATPTIGSIADVIVRKGSNSGPIAFTIGDLETPASALLLQGTSSDPKLVPAKGIAFGGAGANRTITITPAPNRTGKASITVRVSDGIGSATRSFVVTVQATRTTSALGTQLTAEQRMPADPSGVTSAANGMELLSVLGEVTPEQPLELTFAAEAASDGELRIGVLGGELAHFGVAEPLTSPRIQIHDAATMTAPLKRERGVRTVRVTGGAGERGTAVLETSGIAARAGSEPAEVWARSSVSPGWPLIVGFLVLSEVEVLIDTRGAIAEQPRHGEGESAWAPPRLTLHDGLGRELGSSAAVSATPAFPKRADDRGTAGNRNVAGPRLKRKLAPGIYMAVLSAGDGSSLRGAIGLRVSPAEAGPTTNN